MKTICKKIIALMLVAILISFNFSFAVTQSEINEQKNKQTQLNNQINDAEEKKKEVEQEKSETLKEVESLNSQIDGYESQIDELDSQIATANAQIKESEEKIKQNEAEQAKQEEMLKQRLVYVYESGETSYLDFLLSSDNLMDFISNYFLVSEVTQMDKGLLDNLAKQKQEIEDSKKQIEESKQTLTTAKASKENVSNQLKTAKSEKDSKVANLTEQEKAIQKEIDEIKDYEKSVSYKLDAMEKAWKEQNTPKNNTNTTNGGNSTYTNGGTSTYGFGYPVANHNTSNEYGVKKSYYHAPIGHTGLDFTVGEGTPVYAIGDGIATLNYDPPSGWGKNILILHKVNGNKIYSFYAHLNSICVAENSWVTKGTLIGYSGNTGSFSQGAHLHFEIRTPNPSWYSNCQNPRNYLP